MLTRNQYQEIQERLTKYNAWAEQFKQRNGWIVIPQEAQKDAPCEVTNEERSALEVFDFVNDPPEKYFLYINEQTRKATTWTGDTLGEVFFGRSYRDNFGCLRVPISIRAINGKLYHGTYYKSSGSYARVKLAKETRH